MSIIEFSKKTDMRLYHAVKAAMNCEDIMLHYYEKDYDVKYDTDNYDTSSSLSIEESPELIKTAPDKYCDRISRTYLNLLYPDWGFVGEESFDEREMQNETFWCVDPICGTMGFKKKSGFFGTSVALIHKDSGPVLGVMNCPALGIGGAASLERHMTQYFGEPEQHDSEGLKVLVSANRKTSEPFRLMLKILNPAVVGYQESVPSKSLHILMKAYDLHFNLPAAYEGGAPKIWDLAASSVFYAINGMEMTDMDGKPLDLTGQHGWSYRNGYVMAKDKKTLDLCLEAFQKIR